MLRSTFEIRILTVFFAVVMLVGFFQGRVLAEGKKWTIMVFINGDNNLEGAGIDDINEMEKVGSTEDVNILVQFDRAPGFSYSDGDWTSTRRFYINKDNDPYKINSEMLRDLGEVDTGDYHSLVDFARWGMAEYPAEKLLLVVWNHGAGWKKKAEEPIFKGISYDDTSGNHMTTQDIEKALQEIVALRDGQKIDLLGMDACLMQMVEVSYQFRQYVDVCAASEEVEPGDGWAYEDFLAPLMAKPGMDARELGTVIVNTYIGSYSGGSQGNQAVTQSAIDCRKLDELVATIDGFAGTLLTNIKQIGRIKNCLKSTHSFYYDDYKDIGDLAKRISSTFKGGQLQTAAQGLLAKLDEAIIINGTNGSSQAASTGLSIYIPTKYQYKAKYENLAFSQACRWDEFLKASFDPPVPILNIKNIEIIDAGDDGKVSPGESLSLKVTVENTGGAASNGAVLKLSCQDEFVALTASSETLQPIPKKQSITFMGLAAEVSESCPANRRFELKVSLEDEGEKVTESSVDVMVRKPFSVTSNLLLAVPNINAKESKHFTKVLDDLEIPYDVWDIDFEGSMSKGVLFKYLGGIVIRSCPDNNGEGKIGS
ncbi:MAG: clostripain-related cysteine peptidase, partial [bacterium]|nr:clostripain-related cysteine peptidase [bacterium]